MEKRGGRVVTYAHKPPTLNDAPNPGHLLGDKELYLLLARIPGPDHQRAVIRHIVESERSAFCRGHAAGAKVSAEVIPDPLPEHGGIHFCDPPVKFQNTPMEAVNSVWVHPNGEVWVGNGEYASQVNFCPWCGKKAKKQI